jgi:hypothetical protein
MFDTLLFAADPLHGSVTHSVLRHADTPMLTIHYQ